MRKLLNYKVYDQANTSNWLVFIHGAGGSIKTWKKQVDSFKSTYKLLLIDLRDHGLSKEVIPIQDKYSFKLISEDIQKVLDEVGISKADFMTLSFGSVLIQDFATRFPETIGKIIIAGGVFSGSFLLRMFVGTARFFNLFLTYPMMYSLFSYLLMPYPRNQKARKVYKQSATQLSQVEYLKWVGLYHEFFSMLDRFQKTTFHKPTLIIMGSDDYIFLNGAKKFVNKQGFSVLEILPKTGHICNIESSEKFNSSAMQFLMETS